MALLTRGFAALELGDMAGAVAHLSRAVQANAAVGDDERIDSTGEQVLALVFRLFSSFTTFSSFFILLLPSFVSASSSFFSLSLSSSSFS